MIRPFVGICLLLLMLVALGGCGGDDEKTVASTPTQTAGPDTRPEETTPTETATDVTTPAKTSPEKSVPGGPGDEQPAYSPALLTGRDGRIRPRLVRVPPFIAIRVELHSADGSSYVLRFGKHVLRTGTRETDSVLLSGLRPGKRLVGVPVGAGGNGVVIEASAEPGP